MHAADLSQQVGNWHTSRAAASEAALLKKLSSRTVPKKSSRIVGRWSVLKSMSSGDASGRAERSAAVDILSPIISRTFENMVQERARCDELASCVHLAPSSLFLRAFEFVRKGRGF